MKVMKKHLLIVALLLLTCLTGCDNALKKHKGPATTMRLVNKTKDGDTLEITFYGKDFKVFSIGKDFYEAEKSIISK